MAHKYDILAIDLDGTLLDRSGLVSDANLSALYDAREAGIEVVICTGRGVTECGSVLDSIDQRSPVVVAGGSIIACRETGGTLHRFEMCADVVAQAVDRLTSHGHPVMILKDPVVAGYEYLVVADDGCDLHPVSEWWFDHMGVRVRYTDSLDQDEHPDCTVRLGVCGDDDHMAGLLEHIEEEFTETANMHHFPAVVSLQDNTTPAVNGAHDPSPQRIHILELFHKDADKWSSLRWLADRRDVPISRIAAIGDEINDLTMVREAGLGVAMDNAVDDVKQAANVHTARNDRDGVAHAIDHILSGRW